jgi:anti-sigma B factor antagonist
VTETRLTVRRADQGTTAVLELSGEIDAHTAPQLQAAFDELRRDGSDEVIVDLSDVRFVDSLGLRAIVGAHNQLTEDERRFVLRGLSPAVGRAFEYAGLSDHLEIQN